MEACLWQLGFTQLCHKVSKNDFKVTEQLSLLLNSGEVLTRICFRAELDFILIGKQHSDLSSNFLNSGGGQVFLQHHIFHISLVHVRTTFKNGHRRPCWLLRVEKIWENPFSLRKWNIMGQNTLKINEGICQRVIRTCKKSTLIWKNFPIKKYRGEGFLAKNAVFSNFAKFGEILQPLSGGCGSRLSIKKKVKLLRRQCCLCENKSSIFGINNSVSVETTASQVDIFV